jgi:hypothetical protein
MKVVNPNNIEHEIKLISRSQAAENGINLFLYNEATQQETEISLSYLVGFNNYHFVDGYTHLLFNFSFQDNDRYRITLTDSKGAILYRGKLIATAEETQDYQTDNNEYYYE